VTREITSSQARDGYDLNSVRASDWIRPLSSEKREDEDEQEHDTGELTHFDRTDEPPVPLRP